MAYGPGDRQRFDVYVPGNSLDEADKATGSPLVIFIYGGSWNMGSRPTTASRARRWRRRASR